MYQTGLWDDLQCDHGRAYVCEKIQRGLPSAAMHGGHGFGHGGCHKRYGCGNCGKSGCGGCQKKSSCGGCKGGCGGCQKRCKRNPCGDSPCKIHRRKQRMRRRSRRRRRARRRRRRRERRKWRKRMARLRRRKDKKLRKALAQLKRRHAREGRTYGWIADLLHRKLSQMKRTGQIAPFGEDRRRRLLFEDIDQYIFIDVVSRCKMIQNMNGINYEICLNYNVGDEYLSVDIKYVNKKTLKIKKNESKLNYRQSIDITEKHFDDDYQIQMHENDMFAFNPIHSNLGLMINKYDSFNWHNFNTNQDNDDISKYEYGEFDIMYKDFIHYFEQFSFDFHPFDKTGNNTHDNVIINDYIECSQKISDLPFKLCMKTTNVNNEIDTLLYFEKDINDKYDVKEAYSFEIKEYIDKQFEENIFSFNDNNDWDEIEIINAQNGNNINHMQWIKKCNYRLIIGQLCIEQFDLYNNRASIKFKIRNVKRD